MSHEANINPEILRWAREDAGITASEVAYALGLKEKKGRSPEERYFALERGEEGVSWSRVKRLADFYRKPITTFFMRRPPLRSIGVADFRTVADIEPRVQGWLRTLVTNFQARQQELRQLLAEDGREPVRWVGALQSNAPLTECVRLLRDVLSVHFEEQLAIANKDRFLALLRSRAEEAGAFVHFATDLGSWHTQIDADVFRGFCLADDIAPMIVLNGNDARAARSFTLLHELAHLAFGETVISNANPFAEQSDANASEQKCNAVAAEFLLPRRAVEDVWRNFAALPTDVSVQQFAKATSVSRAFSARRLADLGLITRDDWWRLYATYQAEWRRLKEKQKEQDGGPTYYLTTRAKVGDKALRVVFSALDAGEITYTRASRILGVNAHSFDGLRGQLPW